MPQTNHSYFMASLPTPLTADSNQELPRSAQELFFKRVVFLTCPTGLYCREDRCQSFFDFELIPSMRPPLEDCEAAGALHALGAFHTVIDAPAEGIDQVEILKRLGELSPDLLVVSVTFGSLADDLNWVRSLKTTFPKLPIGLRGAPCYVWDKRLLSENPTLDFCVRGDYELVFSQIAQLGLHSAAGVTYRNSDGSITASPAPIAENLDALPFPNRSGIRSELYKVRGFRKPQASIRVQRGCPFPCSYCLVHSVSGNQARHRSPQSIATEMSELMRTGLRHFYLRAETFSLNRRWAIALSNELAKRCPGARWVTTTRVECVDDEVLQVMRAGGCYGISFGVDVASEKIGRMVNKLPQPKAAKAAMRACDKHGIVSLAYFMIGFLWEDNNTLSETASFIKEIRPDLITIHFAHPYPGTAYYEAVRQTQTKVVSLKAQAEPALCLTGLSDRDLKKAARGMLLGHYLRPKVLGSLARKLGTLAIDSLFTKSHCTEANEI